MNNKHSDKSFDGYIGEISIDGAVKKVKPMNDFYLNWLFERSGREAVIKEIINIFIHEYRNINPQTIAEPVKAVKEVTTQYSYYLGKASSRYQDIKIKGDSNTDTYVEFQNKANTDPSISDRAVQYFGLALGHNTGKANQMWLLAEPVKEVLSESSIEVYSLRSETTQKQYPDKSWIMFADLQKAGEAAETEAGALSLFLLGKIKQCEHKNVQEIIDYFMHNFNELKEDKEAIGAMTILERKLEEGKREGKIEGKREGKIETLYTVAKFSIGQISEHLEITEEKVKEVLGELKII
jgi:hypothetical protein